MKPIGMMMLLWWCLSACQFGPAQISEPTFEAPPLPDDSNPPDLSAPTTTVNSGPIGPTQNRHAELVFSCEDLCTFRCQLGSAEAVPCGSPVIYDDLVDGLWMFQVWAKDVAGNEQVTATQHQWTIDNVAPAVVIAQQPEALTAEAEAHVAFDCDQPPCSFECALDEEVPGACVAPWIREVSDGVHTLSLWATDAAGNVLGDPALVSWTVDLVVPELSGFAPASMTVVTADTLSFSAMVSEPASCRWSLLPLSFEELVAQASNQCSTNADLLVSCVATGLVEASEYTIYVACRDAAGNSPSVDLLPLVTYVRVIDVPPACPPFWSISIRCRLVRGPMSSHIWASHRCSLCRCVIPPTAASFGAVTVRSRERRS